MTPGPASRPGPAGGRRRHEAAAGGALLLVAHGRAASAAAAPDGGGGSRSGSDGSSVLGPSLVPLSRKLQDGHSLPRATRTKKKKAQAAAEGDNGDNLARRRLRRNARKDRSIPPRAHAPMGRAAFKSAPYSSTARATSSFDAQFSGRRLSTAEPTTGDLSRALLQRLPCGAFHLQPSLTGHQLQCSVLELA